MTRVLYKAVAQHKSNTSSFFNCVNERTVSLSQIRLIISIKKLRMIILISHFWVQKIIIIRNLQDFKTEWMQLMIHSNFIRVIKLTDSLFNT